MKHQLPHRYLTLLVTLTGLLLAPGCRPRQRGGPSGMAALSQQELERRVEAGDPGALSELGYRSFQSGDHQAALEKLDRALQLDPKSFDGHNLRGMVYADLGRPADAMREFETAAELEPRKSMARFNLGRLLLSQGYSAAAAQALVQAAEVDPKNPTIALAAADAWKLAGSNITAKRWYREVLKLTPKEASAHAGLGEVLTNSGRYEEGRAELTRARELGDTTARTRGYLGLAIALGSGDARDAAAALEHLEAARTAGEREAHLFYGAGRAAMTRHDYPGAERVLKEGMLHYPQAPELYQALGDLYARTGRAAASAAYREKAAELVSTRERESVFVDAIGSQQQSPAPYLAYADWLLSRKEGERAAALLQQAEGRFPHNPEIARRLARARVMAPPWPAGPTRRAP